MSLVENTRNSISGLKELLADDFSSRSEIEQKVKQKIGSLELLDDDDEAVEAIKLLNNFLVECERFAKKLSKLQLKESIYEDALKATQAEQHRDFILKKLEEIDKEKRQFS